MLLSEVVRTAGFVMLTAFTEDAVPDETENPEGYLQDWSGPLHCVRINRETFEGLVRQNGFSISVAEHGQGRPSLYVLEREER